MTCFSEYFSRNTEFLPAIMNRKSTAFINSSIHCYTELRGFQIFPGNRQWLPWCRKHGMKLVQWGAKLKMNSVQSHLTYSIGISRGNLNRSNLNIVRTGNVILCNTHIGTISRPDILTLLNPALTRVSVERHWLEGVFFASPRLSRQLSFIARRAR